MLNDDMSGVTGDHLDHFKASTIAALKNVRDLIVSSSSNSWIEWLYQQKCFLKEAIESLIDKKVQINTFEKEKEELTQNEIMRLPKTFY